jgi:hypothetical protein
VDVVGEVLYEEGYRRESVVLDYELVVIEHHYHPLGPLSQLVYEHGKCYLAEPLTRGVHPHKKTCPEVFSWRTLGRNLAQRFYNVPPQPGWIVVLLVDGDPGEVQASFFCLTPLGKERGLAVAGRGTYEGKLAIGS